MRQGAANVLAIAPSVGPLGSVGQGLKLLSHAYEPREDRRSLRLPARSFDRVLRKQSGP